MTDWKCTGCGKPTPNRVRNCDCPSGVVYRSDGPTEWKLAPDLYRLSKTIRTKLLGVRPEDQDVVLDDDDWRLILETIDQVQK